MLKAADLLADLQAKYSDAERAEMYDNLIVRLQLAMMAGRDCLKDEVTHELNGLHGHMPHPEDVIDDAMQHREFEWLETLWRCLERAMRYVFNERDYDRRHREEMLRLAHYADEVSSRVTRPPIPDHYPTSPPTFMGVDMARGDSTSTIPPLKNPFDNYR